MENKNGQLAESILKLVGGKENVSSFTHCITRLRFVLKDQSLIQEEELKELKGVMGCQFSNGQFQVIIGPGVGKVYDEICRIGDFGKGVQPAKQKEKLTVKKAFGAVISSLSACVIPVLPIFICCGMLKMITTVLGPTMTGVMDVESGVGLVLTFAGNAGFYFLPIFLGYTSAKQFKANPYIGMLMGAILVSPTLIEIVNNGTALTILGIPVTPVNYANSVVPIILIVWVMSYVERLFNKIIPDVVKMVFVPVCTILIMLPIGLCLLGPLGTILGNGINEALLAFYDIAGPIGVGVVAALFLPLIMTGMHHALNMTAMATIASVGYESVVLVGGTIATMACIGATLAFGLKAKKKENKSIGLSSCFFVTVGGLSEPAIYGVLLPFRRPFIGQAIGAFIGAVYIGITHASVYMMGASSVLGVLNFAGGSTANFVNGVIGCVIAAVAGFIATWLLGFKENEE